ncbi:lamin tail domain-containing protein [Flagellimonas meridianipacifica]|uniref:Lamin tail-like protein n=1 Tax=Flagellimonas meridianipacifica TaxID=1080225 RepID=A0A2T0MK33_9FLAO|nr:lamin tail domain-containing protein [Allomuricauda pacifica]PRX57909.1 hypothetical protein CLV81_1923 [Allomuricauda pacifica]
MKKYVFVMALLAMTWSCSEDDTEIIIDDPVVDNPTPPDPTGSASVVINEVAYLEGSVELFNDGDINVDLSDYFLCLGPGTYRRIGDLETEGNVDLAPGEYLVIGYDMPNEEGGIGLYANNDGFGDAANIRSFVQWGAAGSPRENVAVEANIWTEGEFIPVVEDEDNSIVYDGEGISASDWSETTTPSLGAENEFNAPVQSASIILNEVAYLGDSIELYNNGAIDVDVSDYFLCLGPGTYRRIGDLQTEGDVNMTPGSFLTVAYEMPNAEGGIGLYANNAGFGDPVNIRSFVQWGAPGSPRENVAVAANIWTEGEYVEVVGSADNSIAYDGEGFSASDWSETTETTFGAANIFTAPTVRSIVINEVEYLVDDLIELYNNGTETVDLSNYWMCLGPGQYFRVGDAAATEIVSGNVNLAPGEFLVISPVSLEASNDAGGLGLYANNDGFGDAANIRSFVQWGAAGNARESVAVEAGIWNAGGFVPNVPFGSSIAYDGEGFTSNDWEGTSTQTFGDANVFREPLEKRSVIINEVEYLIDDEIELYNNGNVAVDLSNYWMCLGPGQYFRIGDAAATDIVSGNVSLNPGEFLVISPVSLSAPDNAGGLGLYANNDSFGDAANIRSFVQWGAAGNARESVAVEAGIWNAGGFVPNVAAGSSIAYDGEGFTSNDWDEDTTPTLGLSNSAILQ